MVRNIVEDIQLVSDFLSHRNCDIDSLHAVDIIILAGNALPSTAAFAADCYHKAISKKILICGGYGHSTPLLYENMARMGYRSKELCEGHSEAELLAEVLYRKGISPSAVLLECTSTNTGANAGNTLTLLEEKGYHIQNMLLIQDPLLQLRTYATFQKEFPDVRIYSYAPFKACIDEDGNPIQTHPDLWDTPRLISLIIGEIKRIKDDENGYGPKGKNYMIHIDVPQAILEAAQHIEQVYKAYALR